MKKTNYLTNENLKSKFKSFFDLANYGIKLAKEKILQEETVTLADVIEELCQIPDQSAAETI